MHAYGKKKLKFITNNQLRWQSFEEYSKGFEIEKKIPENINNHIERFAWDDKTLHI